MKNLFLFQLIRYILRTHGLSNYLWLFSLFLLTITTFITLCLIGLALVEYYFFGMNLPQGVIFTSSLFILILLFFFTNVVVENIKLFKRFKLNRIFWYSMAIDISRTEHIKNILYRLKIASDKFENIHYFLDSELSRNHLLYHKYLKNPPSHYTIIVLSKDLNSLIQFKLML